MDRKEALDLLAELEKQDRGGKKTLDEDWWRELMPDINDGTLGFMKV